MANLQHFIVFLPNALYKIQFFYLVFDDSLYLLFDDLLFTIYLVIEYLAIVRQLDTVDFFNFQFPTFNFQLSIFNCQLSIINCQLSIISDFARNHLNLSPHSILS